MASIRRFSSSEFGHQHVVYKFSHSKINVRLIHSCLTNRVYSTHSIHCFHKYFMLVSSNLELILNTSTSIIFIRRNVIRNKTNTICILIMFSFKLLSLLLLSSKMCVLCLLLKFNNHHFSQKKIVCFF